MELRKPSRTKSSPSSSSTSSSDCVVIEDSGGSDESSDDEKSEEYGKSETPPSDDLFSSAIRKREHSRRIGNFFDVDEISQVQLMVEAVRRRINSVVQDRIMAQEEVVVRV